MGLFSICSTKIVAAFLANVWSKLDKKRMTNEDKTKDAKPITSDREQRYQVLETLLTWTAEELSELGLADSAKSIREIRDKVALKVGR